MKTSKAIAVANLIDRFTLEKCRPIAGFGEQLEIAQFLKGQLSHRFDTPCGEMRYAEFARRVITGSLGTTERQLVIEAGNAVQERLAAEMMHTLQGTQWERHAQESYRTQIDDCKRPIHEAMEELGESSKLGQSINMRAGGLAGINRQVDNIAMDLITRTSVELFLQSEASSSQGLADRVRNVLQGLVRGESAQALNPSITTVLSGHGLAPARLHEVLDPIARQAARWQEDSEPLAASRWGHSVDDDGRPSDPMGEHWRQQQGRGADRAPLEGNPLANLEEFALQRALLDRFRARESRPSGAGMSQAAATAQPATRTASSADREIDSVAPAVALSHAFAALGITPERYTGAGQGTSLAHTTLEHFERIQRSITRSEPEKTGRLAQALVESGLLNSMVNAMSIPTVEARLSLTERARGLKQCVLATHVSANHLDFLRLMLKAQHVSAARVLNALKGSSSKSILQSIATQLATPSDSSEMRRAQCQLACSITLLLRRIKHHLPVSEAAKFEDALKQGQRASFLDTLSGSEQTGPTFVAHTLLNRFNLSPPRPESANHSAEARELMMDAELDRLERPQGDTPTMVRRAMDHRSSSAEVIEQLKAVVIDAARPNAPASTFS